MINWFVPFNGGGYKNDLQCRVSPNVSKDGGDEVTSTAAFIDCAKSPARDTGTPPSYDPEACGHCGRPLNLRSSLHMGSMCVLQGHPKLSNPWWNSRHFGSSALAQATSSLGPCKQFDLFW